MEPILVSGCKAAEQVVEPRQERVGVECEWVCGCWTGGAKFEVVVVGEDGDGGWESAKRC